MKIECGTCKWISKHKAKKGSTWFLCDQLDMRISGGPSDRYATKCDFYKPSKKIKNI